MDVIFYDDARGREAAVEYLDRLERNGELMAIGMFEHATDLLGRYGSTIGMPFSRLIDRNRRVYELRFGDHRMGYIVHGGQAVLLHGWRKRTQRLDVREVARAATEAENWRARHPGA